MNNTNRLGCLTSTGLLSGIITLFVLVGAAFASGGQMFSSGPLNDEHGRMIGGVDSHSQITDCNTCHSAPWDRATMADRCLACHTNIAAEMLNVAQLHGSIVQKAPNIACRDCHHEHRGKFASLTELGENTFPHETLGFFLTRHVQMPSGAAIGCADCHGDNVTTFAADSCQTCHSSLNIAFAQAHLLSFGSDCLACHDGADRFSNFNHNAYPFKLKDGHAGDIPCTRCHLDARSIADLQATPQNCYFCHQADDPHSGQYGTQCETCHNPSSWENATFDHNLAAFKLEGEHAEAACDQCHINNVYKGTPQDCYSCHQQDDAHNGQYGTQCEACHNPSSWENATFDHSRTNFPLNGGHANVACERCHASGSYKGLSTACAGCHQDPPFHVGAFGTDCQSCHSINAWSPAQFNISHPEPRTDEGGSGIYHGGTSCRTCHPASVNQSTCVACHEGNNFEDEGGGEGGDD